MAHHSIPPLTHDQDIPSQFGTFDTFQAKAKLWLVGEGVDHLHQYDKIILMLGDTGLKKGKKFNMSEENRKDPAKVSKKFRESMGNNI